MGKNLGEAKIQNGRRTGRAFHAHGTRFSWSSENALQEHFIVRDSMEYDGKTLQLTVSIEKMLTFQAAHR